MSVVKGWCPSAHRPMMSGDGLLVRVKPRLGRLSAGDLRTICDLAERFGNGVIDLTSRANLQIRGGAVNDHAVLLAQLIGAGLVDADPAREERRNILVNHFWAADHVTVRLADDIYGRLDELPKLPGKMGVAIDIGPERFAGISGDFRFERSADGLILRADGADAGWLISEEDAVDALSEMANWFVRTGGRDSGRMHRHLRTVDLPSAWQSASPVPQTDAPPPGTSPHGQLVGVAFGATLARDLANLIDQSRADHIRVTPWRMLLLEGVSGIVVPGLVTGPDRVLGVSACPGSPVCAQAMVKTRDLARRLAESQADLHVSGCAKGCAHPSAAKVTLVGQDGRFALVRNGCAGDTPERTGLTEAEVVELVG